MFASILTMQPLQTGGHKEISLDIFSALLMVIYNFLKINMVLLL